MGADRGGRITRPATRRVTSNLTRMDLPTFLGELTSGDDERAERAVAQLAASPLSSDDALCDALQGLLSSPSAAAPGGEDLRWWALRALAELSHPQVSSTLSLYLTDPQPDVRQCAALGLRKRADPQTIPALITALSDLNPGFKEHSLTATLAADTLIVIGSSAVPALLDVMQHGEAQARREAARALALIGDPRAAPALCQALDDDSATVAYWANEGLERMGIGTILLKLSS